MTYSFWVSITWDLPVDNQIIMFITGVTLSLLLVISLVIDVFLFIKRFINDTKTEKKKDDYILFV